MESPRKAFADVQSAIETYAQAVRADAYMDGHDLAIAQFIGHWFTQGGYGTFGANIQGHNADELIANILEITRAHHADAYAQQGTGQPIETAPKDRAEYAAEIRKDQP